MDKKGEDSDKMMEDVGDDLEEELNDRSGEPEVNANPPGDEIDINHDNINEAEAAEAALEAEAANEGLAPPVGDEIDVMNDVGPLPPPEINFHHLDNALQHVQGHMDTMMHNLGGLQSSVKHLKHNLNQFCVNQKSHENERNVMRLSLHSDILQSWRDGRFSDLTLVDDAGSRHKVHKVVLASRSSYFKAQLTNWDKDEPVLEIKIVSSEILKIVLEFIYTLDVQSQINNNNVVDLLQAANIYDLKLLREECVMFLKLRIREDFSLEAYASDFLARNFSSFLSNPDKKIELLELPVDKIKLVLDSKVLVLRDQFYLPLKTIVREGKILEFVLAYISHREEARLIHAAKLLSLVKLYLLPLNTELSFSPERFLPDSVLQLMATKLVKYPDALRLLKQTELDVKSLHSLKDPGHLFQQTNKKETKVGGGGERLADRHNNWDLLVAREAGICHEWWTAHAHDSRFVPVSNNINNANLKIIGVSGSGDGKKFIRKIIFYIGDVKENTDLLPDWFNMAPQYGMNNMNQDLGEYIGAMYIVWSDGKENRIGENGDLKRGVSISLEEGEHIINTFQLFWGPRHVFLPLEVVDFVFFTNRGRKFGPFTKQVRKSCDEGEIAQRKPDSWNLVTHKVTCRKIGRRVESPLVPLCRTATLTELSNTNLERMEDDSNWASWLDGFLCVTKRGKITRITVKFAVYLNCFYMQKKVSPSKPPVLYSYSLKDLKDNLTGKPIKILDQDYLWEHLLTPLNPAEDDERLKFKKRKLWNEYLVGFDNGIPLGDPVLEPLAIPPVLLQEVEIGEVLGAGDGGDNDDAPNENANNNNNEEPHAGGDDEPEAPGEAEEAEEPDIHDHVWDALINDDIRQIGELYERDHINVESYLE